MTKEIDYRISTLDHATKQAPGLRYELSCVTGSYQPGGGQTCESGNRMGHLDDFEEYEEAKKAGIEHPHPVRITFYPDFEKHKEPSGEFLADYKKQEDNSKS